MDTVNIFQNVKQIIVVNETLKQPKKKRAAQMAQASAGAFFEAGKDVKKAWLKEGRPKIVLKALGADDLRDLLSKAEKRKLPIYLVEDKVRPSSATATVACLGIGPVCDEQVNQMMDIFNYYCWVRENAFNVR